MAALMGRDDSRSSAKAPETWAAGTSKTIFMSCRQWAGAYSLEQLTGGDLNLVGFLAHMAFNSGLFSMCL